MASGAGTKNQVDRGFDSKTPSRQGEGRMEGETGSRQTGRMGGQVDQVWGGRGTNIGWTTKDVGRSTKMIENN